MPAFLALIPTKDWIYCAVLLALIGAFGAYTIHERHEGAAKIEAAAAKAVTKANGEVAKDNAVAATTESQNATVYERAISIPAIGDIGIVCQRAAPRSISLPAARAGSAPGIREQPADGTVGPQYDPTGAALTRAHDADAQIIYLQGRIHELEAQMNGAP